MSTSTQNSSGKQSLTTNQESEPLPHNQRTEAQGYSRTFFDSPTKHSVLLTTYSICQFVVMFFGASLEPNIARRLMLLAALAFLVVSEFGDRRIRIAFNEWLRKRERRQTKLQTIATAERGRVRLRGRTKVLKSVTNAEGNQCLAYQVVRPLNKQCGFFVAGAAGDFLLDDDSGVRAIVRGPFACVGDTTNVGESKHIPIDATIELIGNARWLTREEVVSSSNYRDPTPLLEISGSAEEPLLLTILEEENTSTPVRAEPKQEEEPRTHEVSFPPPFQSPTYGLHHHRSY